MKNLQLTKEQITQIVAVVFFGGLLGYLYVAYFWLPVSKNIAEKTKKIESLDRDIQNAQRKKAQFKNLEKKLQSLKVQKEDAQKKLPRSKKIPDLIDKLTRLSKKHNVEITSISPSSEKREQYFTKVYYVINARANYHDLGRFFTALALQERIFTFENVAVNGTPDGDYSALVNFSLVSYLYSS